MAAIGNLIDAFRDYNVRSFPNLDPPVMETPILGLGVTPESTTYTYEATFRTIDGETIPGTAVSITNAPATLSSANNIKLQVLAANIPAQARSVRFYKSTNAGYFLLGEVDASIGFIYDTGQAVGTDVPPGVNTSGRPDFLALGYHPGEWRQRQEGIDDQTIKLMSDQRLWGTIQQDGDIISGLTESNVTGTQWTFAPGKVYWSGRILDVPAPETPISLTGTGSEIVGIVANAGWVTPDQDGVLRAAADEGQPTELSAMGADRLVVTWTWGINQTGQIPIKEFNNGIPLTKTLPVVRTELDRRLASMLYAVAGNFVVKPFPTEVLEHPTDPDKLVLNVKSGEAWVLGYQRINDYPIPLEFDRARDTLLVNNSAVQGFVCTGGQITTANAEPYNVDGKNISVTVGSGAAHTVALTGTSETATQVAAQITTALNAIPRSGSLVTTVVASGKFTLRAPDGKPITINAATNDAYTALGWTAGTYAPTGTRVYKINDNYIKSVSDLNYKHEFVEAVTHNVTTHIDPLPHSNVTSIVGAALSVTACHDGAFDYQNNLDFVQSGNSISFAGMGGAEPANGQTYYVKYQVEYNATKGVRDLVEVIDAQVTKGEAGGQDVITFTSATSIKRVRDGVTVALTGNAKDVYSVLRVNNTPGKTQTDYTSYVFTKNAGALTVDNSILDWVNAGAAGTGATGQPATSAKYYVSFRVWQHTTEGDYVTADSYDQYEQIETYGGLALRDCVDFRTVNGLWPVPGENPVMDYLFYLSRIDKLTLDSFGKFAIVRGAPALNPVLPQETADVMCLGIVSVQPYTYTTDNVTVVPTQPVRLQQSDLQDDRKRIQRIEYNEANSQLASEVAGHPLAAQATGIFSDAITGFKNVDLNFNVNGVSHTMAIDLANQQACLPATQTVKTLEIDDTVTTGVKKIGNSLVLDYQPTVLISQPIATKTINLNPDNIVSYTNGTIKLTPASCVFNDVTQMPQLNVDFDNNLSGLITQMQAAGINISDISSTVWSNWRIATPTDVQAATAAGMIWNGGHTQEVAASLMGLNWWQVGGGATFARTATTTNTTLAVENLTQSLGDRVVDMSLVPMMKTTNDDGTPFKIQINGVGLEPNTDHACTIAGIAADLVVDSSVSPSYGTAGTLTYKGAATVKTDDHGRLTAYFNMPAGVPVGSQTVMVFDANTTTASSAQSAFYSQGFHTDQQSTVVGFDSLVQRTTTTVGGVGGTQAVTSWGDPIAMSFLTKNNIDYVCQLKLYFAKKSATIPVTVDVRAMSNGYPTRTVLASCTIDPADVVVSTDGSQPTVFTFENILGYKQNEYCFVAISNCDEYEVFSAKMGQTDLVTGLPVQARPYPGVLFHSPNNSTWEAMDQEVLKFDILTANFVNDCHIRFKELTGVQASILALRVDEFLGSGTTASWTYQVSGSTDWIPFHPEFDVTLQNIISTVTLDINVTSLGGSYQLVDQIAGIVLLLHQSSAYYVGNAMFETDELNYPNSISMIIDMDADGVNGVGTRSITPYFTIDEGKTLVEIEPPAGFTPTGLSQQPFYRWEFTTPAEQTATSASNATPIHIDSASNRFKDNAIVVIAGFGGNTAANGTWRVKNSSSTGFDLVDPVTGADSVGNGEPTGTGTINLAEFSQFRPIVLGTTSNQAATPFLKSVNAIPARV